MQTYFVTSFQTVTHVLTDYVTTEYEVTGVQGVFSQTTVIPVQIQLTQVYATVLQRTATVEMTHTLTLTRHSVFPQTTSLVLTSRSTSTLDFYSAYFRSFSDNMLWLIIGAIIPIVAYHRINAYRTRVHIYYVILRYAANTPRSSTHIMRGCNLETRMCRKYIQNLKESGFLEEIRQDGSRMFRASSKGQKLLRNEELRLLLEQLP